MKFIQTLLCLFTLLYAVNLSAQDTKDKKELSFFTVAPRVGVIVHNGFGVEAGISFLSVDIRDISFGAASFYATYFIQQKDFDSALDIDGFKAGVQGSWGPFMGGIEVKTGSYNQRMFTYISPKIGLSLLDAVNVEYLINIAGKSDNFPWRSNHQIGLNISWNRKIHDTFCKS